ncbi:hypothetical protein BC936DRAFT_143953, partial [Jimgerdemannia flammicorona]
TSSSTLSLPSFGWLSWLWLSDLTGPTYHVHRSYRAVSTQFVCAVSDEEDSACCGWILVYVQTESAPLSLSSPSLLSTPAPSIPSGRGRGMLPACSEICFVNLQIDFEYAVYMVIYFIWSSHSSQATFFYTVIVTGNFNKGLKQHMQRLFDENCHNYVDPTMNFNLGSTGAHTATHWMIVEPVAWAWEGGMAGGNCLGA